jgi:hypothetical protein
MMNIYKMGICRFMIMSNVYYSIGLITNGGPSCLTQDFTEPKWVSAAYAGLLISGELMHTVSGGLAVKRGTRSPFVVNREMSSSCLQRAIQAGKLNLAFIN